MTTLRIKSRIFNKEFKFDKRGSYIYCNDQQICSNGSWLGNTITCTKKSFLLKCKKWYKAMYRHERQHIDFI